jgi:flagellar biosynthesis protein FliP
MTCSANWWASVTRIALVGLMALAGPSVLAQGLLPSPQNLAGTTSPVARAPASAAIPARQSDEAASVPLERVDADLAGRKPSRTPASAPRQSVASAGMALDIRLPRGATAAGETALAVRMVLGLTLLAVLPALLVCVTAFLRIIVVLSMLRHAMGMPETPPNTVLIGLAMFLTLFSMSPVLQTLNQEAFQPFMQGSLSNEDAYAKASKPLREFMIRQTREQDLALMIDLAKAPMPQSMDEVSSIQLIPAFMLSELRAAFQIGFVIFLPFLLIDLIVSSILMALGMMMMPPVTVALPLKVLMFILVDGWSLILKALVGSFH